MEVEEVIKRCKGIKCGFKETSCPMPIEVNKTIKPVNNPIPNIITNIASCAYNTTFFVV